MAAAGTAAATECSKCTSLFTTDGPRPAGSCSSCADGDSLCRKCVDRHATDARFVGHACRSLEDLYAGTDFLERMQLNPTPKACPLHAQPFLGLRCSACSAAGKAGSISNILCAACVKVHAISHPTHVLTHFAPDVLALRQQLRSLIAATGRTPGDPVSAASSVSDAAASVVASTNVRAAAPDAALAAAQTAPLVLNARRKAAAVQSERDVLEVNKEAALSQLEANRDAVIAAVQARYVVGVDAVHAAAATKQAGLDAELQAADTAVSSAISATAALEEVRPGCASTFPCQSFQSFHLPLSFPLD